MMMRRTSPDMKPMLKVIGQHRSSGRSCSSRASCWRRLPCQQLTVCCRLHATGCLCYLGSRRLLWAETICLCQGRSLMLCISVCMLIWLTGSSLKDTLRVNSEPCAHPC